MVQASEVKVTQLSQHEHSQHSTLRCNGMESCLSCTAIQATAFAACGRVPVTVLYLNRQNTQRACFSLQWHVFLTWSLHALFQTADTTAICITLLFRHSQGFLSLVKIKLVWFIFKDARGKTQFWPTKWQLSGKEKKNIFRTIHLQFGLMK